MRIKGGTLQEPIASFWHSAFSHHSLKTAIYVRKNILSTKQEFLLITNGCLPFGLPVWSFVSGYIAKSIPYPPPPPPPPPLKRDGTAINNTDVGLCGPCEKIGFYTIVVGPDEPNYKRPILILDLLICNNKPEVSCVSLTYTKENILFKKNCAVALKCSDSTLLKIETYNIKAWLNEQDGKNLLFFRE